ncbi:MAG: TIGR03915 family putative DNA repair protein [Oscillospiraceae bacterium]|jgi:probable DNA metabolism protein|nr:TIGR03915 family putative DNA repair protein [Oscillospiraceae bacterium]
MAARRALTLRQTDLVYRYDGGLAGLYSCVYDGVYGREMPLDILPDREEMAQLLPERRVDTNREHAERVRRAVGEKISPRALELAETVFLSCLPRRELHILRFLLLGFEMGARVTNLLTHPDVMPLLRAERHLYNEAHLLSGFLRFSDYQGTLVATMRPKNFVLPLLSQHFIDRMPGERFLIYDRTHGAALSFADGRAEVVEVADFAPPEADETEALYRALFRRFYDTIAIEARVNHKLRMNHMPKRYWSEMTEMQ